MRGVFPLSAVPPAGSCLSGPPRRIISGASFMNACTSATLVLEQLPRVDLPVWSLNCNGTKNKVVSYGELFCGGPGLLLLQEVTDPVGLRAILPPTMGLLTGLAQASHRTLAVAWDHVSFPNGLYIIADSDQFFVVLGTTASGATICIADVHLYSSATVSSVDTQLKLLTLAMEIPGAVYHIDAGDFNTTYEEGSRLCRAVDTGHLRRLALSPAHTDAPTHKQLHCKSPRLDYILASKTLFATSTTLTEVGSDHLLLTTTLVVPHDVSDPFAWKSVKWGKLSAS